MQDKLTPSYLFFTKYCPRKEQGSRYRIKTHTRTYTEIKTDLSSHSTVYSQRTQHIMDTRHVAVVEVCVEKRLHYHQDTKPRDLAEHVTKLPRETVKPKPHFLHKNNGITYDSRS